MIRRFFACPTVCRAWVLDHFPKPGLDRPNASGIPDDICDSSHLIALTEHFASGRGAGGSTDVAAIQPKASIG